MSCYRRSLISFLALSLCKAVAIIAIFFSGVSYAEGELVVMDAAYYYQCRDDFYRDCSLLQRQVDNFKAYADSELSYVTNAFWTISYDASLARQNAEYIMSESSDPAVQSKADDIIMYANNCENVSLSGYNRAVTLLSDVDSFVDNFTATISVVSNTFPVQVTSTNFVINVVVSNYFDLATNLYNDAQASYTNFLNYYSGIEDSLLNQYRATVTNLLDWTNLNNWLNSSYWIYNSPSRYGDNYRYVNFDFIGGMYGGMTALNILGNSANNQYWGGRYFELPTDATPIDATIFSLQGIHDAVQWTAKLQVERQLFFYQASTGWVYTLPNSGAVITRMKEFLTMPEGYTNQVANISQSRNFYQRLEHWLSAIALNTATTPSGNVESADTSNQFDDNVNIFTNDLQNAISGLNQPLVNLGRMTNLTVGVRGLVGSVGVFLDSFRSGGNRSSSPPSDFKLMSTSFIQENFSRYDLEFETHDDQGELRYIGVNAYTTGFDTVSSAVKWVHHIFGLLWYVIGLGLLCYVTYWLCVFGFKFWDKVITVIVRLVSFAFKD